MNKLQGRLYYWLLNNPGNWSYGDLAKLTSDDFQIVTKRDVIEAVNMLVGSGRIECDAVESLGDGDYLCRFEVEKT